MSIKLPVVFIAAVIALTISVSSQAGTGAYDMFLNSQGGIFIGKDSREVHNQGCSDDGGYSEPVCSEQTIKADAADWSAGVNSYDAVAIQHSVLRATTMEATLTTTGPSYVEFCCSAYSLFDVEFATSNPGDPQSGWNRVLDYTLSGTIENEWASVRLYTFFGGGSSVPYFDVTITQDDVNPVDGSFKIHGTLGEATIYRLVARADMVANGYIFKTTNFKLTTAEVAMNGSRVQSIHNMEIDGEIYNAYFDQQAGGNIFDGDEAGGLAAMNAINDVLNSDFNEVDNEHPLSAPMYSVMTNMDTMTAHQSCNISAVPTCDTGDWAGQGLVIGLSSDQSAVYFERIVLPAEIDGRLSSSNNTIDPDDTSTLPAAIMTTAVASGDAADFDIADLATDSITFGPAAAPNVLTPLVRDIDGDGDNDMRVGYVPFDSGIGCEDTEIKMQAKTLGGWTIEGTDNITTPDCPDAGCHP